MTFLFIAYSKIQSSNAKYESTLRIIITGQVCAKMKLKFRLYVSNLKHCNIDHPRSVH